MRITEVSVRRLKSLSNFSNIAVELKADVSPNDSVDEVFEVLLQQCNKLIELAPEIEMRDSLLKEIDKLKEEVKDELLRYEEAVRSYEKVRDEIRMMRMTLEAELEALKSRLDEKKSLVSKIKEKVGGG